MSDERVMLLIDADNVSIDVMEQAVRLLLNQHGGVHVRRAYCTAESAVKHQAAFKRLAIKPMVNLAAGKNSTDIALAVDAIDLVLAERPDVVVIASSDSDFAPLVQRLREKGCVVRGIGQHGKTGDETQDVYDDYTVLAHRKGPEGRAGPPPRSPRGRPARGSTLAPVRATAAPRPAATGPASGAAAELAPAPAPLPRPLPAPIPLAEPAQPPAAEDLLPETADPVPATEDVQAPAPARKRAAKAAATKKAATKKVAVKKAPAKKAAAAKTAAKKAPAKKVAAKRTAAKAAAAGEPADQPLPATTAAEAAATPAPPPAAAEPAAGAPPSPAADPAPATGPAAPAPRPRQQQAQHPNGGARPGTTAQAVLQCLPELAAGKALALNVVAERLRKAQLLGKNSSSLKLFAQLADQFELLPADRPSQVRLRG